MNYVQHNPVPAPEGDAVHVVETTMDSAFDWRYALEKQDLLALYEKGKAARVEGDRSRLGRSVVDVEKRMTAARRAEGSPFHRDQPRSSLPPQPLEDVASSTDLNTHMICAFMLSQFLHGEQGALLVDCQDRASRCPGRKPSGTPPTRSPTKPATSRCTTATSPRSSCVSLRGPPEPRRSLLDDILRRQLAGTSPTSACRSWWRGSRSRPSG